MIRLGRARVNAAAGPPALTVEDGSELAEDLHIYGGQARDSRRPARRGRPASLVAAGRSRSRHGNRLAALRAPSPTPGYTPRREPHERPRLVRLLASGRRGSGREHCRGEGFRALVAVRRSSSALSTLAVQCSPTLSDAPPSFGSARPSVRGYSFGNDRGVRRLTGGTPQRAGARIGRQFEGLKAAVEVVALGAHVARVTEPMRRMQQQMQPLAQAAEPLRQAGRRSRRTCAPSSSRCGTLPA